MKTYYHMKILRACTIIMVLVTAAITACKKEATQSVPKVETASVDEVFNTSARVGGRVSDDGGTTITERGVYWGKDSMPETTGTKRAIGEGGGEFYDTLNGLTPGTKYFVKAYAISSLGTGYGTETSFTTQIHLPTVLTSPVTDYTATTATIGGQVIDDGGFRIIQRGLYWGTDPNPRLTGIKVVLDTGLGNFTFPLQDLDRARMYYAVAYATNIKGTSFGNEISFNTVPELPVVSTAPVKYVRAHAATFGGNVTSDGGNAITERGVYYGTSADVQTSGTKLALGTGTGSFAQKTENLLAGTRYYVQAFATNSQGTAWGEVKMDSTLGRAPVINPLLFKDLGTYGVTLQTAVNPNFLNTDVVMEYGTSSSYGSQITFNVTTDTNLFDTLSAVLSALNFHTVYHYRITASNELGSAETSDSLFQTYLTGITGNASDADGNNYTTIGIGYQVWMQQNLASTKLNDNTIIKEELTDSAWVAAGTSGSAAFSWYENKTANKTPYGALYNFKVVSSGKLCPAGWHVPTDQDFTELVNYLKGSDKAGEALKEAGSAHWQDPNTGANNSTKFNALPGGKRLPDGTFDFQGVEGDFWSSSSYSTLNATYFYLLSSFGFSFQAYTGKNTGMSVRCVGD